MRVAFFIASLMCFLSIASTSAYAAKELVCIGMNPEHPENIIIDVDCSTRQSASQSMMSAYFEISRASTASAYAYAEMCAAAARRVQDFPPSFDARDLLGTIPAQLVACNIGLYEIPEAPPQLDFGQISALDANPEFINLIACSLVLEWLSAQPDVYKPNITPLAEALMLAGRDKARDIGADDGAFSGFVSLARQSFQEKMASADSDIDPTICLLRAIPIAAELGEKPPEAFPSAEASQTDVSKDAQAIDIEPVDEPKSPESEVAQGSIDEEADDTSTAIIHQRSLFDFSEHKLNTNYDGVECKFTLVRQVISSGSNSVIANGFFGVDGARLYPITGVWLTVSDVGAPAFSDADLAFVKKGSIAGTLQTYALHENGIGEPELPFAAVLDGSSGEIYEDLPVGTVPFLVDAGKLRISMNIENCER